VVRPLPPVPHLTPQRHISTAAAHIPTSAPQPLAFSHDGELLAVIRGETVRLHAIPDLKLVRTQRADSLVRAVAFSPDGQLVAAATEGTGVMLWRVADGSFVRDLVASPQSDPFVATCLAFDNEGQRLAAGATASAPALWRVNDGAAQPVVGPVRAAWGRQSSVAFGRDGASLIMVEASESNRGDYALFTPTLIRFWDLTSRREVGPPIQTDARIGGVLSADGAWVALNPPGAPQLWRLDGPGQARPLRAYPSQQPVSVLAVSSDGAFVVGIGRQEAYLWRAQDGALLCLYDHRQYWRREADLPAITVSPDGRWVATYTEDGIFLWPGI
jgi:WD40 repeat protein